MGLFNRHKRRKRPIKDAMAAMENAGDQGALTAMAIRELVKDVDEFLDDLSEFFADLQEIVDKVKAQGFLEADVDVTDNPMLAKIGIDGVIKGKVKLPE